MGLIRRFFRQRNANGFTRRLAGAALILLVFSGFAEAQSSCTLTPPTANAVFIRAEGTAEQVGDLMFSCSGSGVSGTANISVYLSPAVSITSKVLNSTTGETEALAVTNSGQTVRGIVSGSSVSFNSLPVPAGTFSVTLTNVRVNASQLASGSGFPTGVSETIFVDGTNTAPAVLEPAPTVAYVAPSLSQTNAANTTYPACFNLTPASGPVFVVPFAENFPSAFKTPGGAGNTLLGSEFTANTETGFYENDSGSTNQANSGTRVRVVFTNVPSGVGLYVPITLTGTGQTATTPTARLTTTEAGVFFPYSATSGAGIPSSPQMAVLAVNSGAAEAVYEITSQDPSSYDSFDVPVYLNASSATLIAATIPITAAVNMAPVGSTNIPNFVAENSLTFTATASSGCSFTISPMSLPAATQNASYSQQLTAGPGSGALMWSVSAGSLPAGVTLNSVSGLLSGTPTASGTFTFTAKVADQGTNQTMQAFTLQVNAAPTGGSTACSNAASNSNLIRAEGLSEQVGDLTFTCSGGGGFATISVGLSPALSITSKVLAASNGATEAAAITSAGSVNGIVNGSEILFYNVPLPSGTSTVTITNIRVNAAALTGSLPGSIAETVFVSGAYVTPAFVSSSNTTVAYVVPGLAQTSAASATYSACATLTPASGAAFVVKFGEDFPSAFKTQGGAANSTLGSEFTANTETGFFETVSGISNLANSGTRIRVVFTNIPAGVGVYVPATLTGTGQTSVVPMLRLTASEAGAFSAVAAATGSGLPASPALAQIVISGGTGEAVYEVTSQDPNSLESFSVPVYLSGTSAALTSASSPITATVNLAPVGVSGIPVFAAANALPVNATASATCIFTISPSSLPLATENASYSQQLIAGPGKSAPAWSISAGNLPAGLSLDPVAGVVSGVPTVTGSFTFTAKAVDQSSDVATQQFTLQVSPPIMNSGFSSTCTPNTGAVFLRAEGVTERVADTTLSCTGGGGTVTLQVFINPQLPITSKVLPASGATEALALTSSGSVQGVVNGSSVVFYGVQVPAGSSTVTITNIRVNASALSIIGGAPTAVTETSLFYGPGVVTTALAVNNTGFVTNGLATPAISNVTNYSVNSPIIVSPSFTLSTGEGFSGAFKTQAQETGTPIGNSNAANSGTRIRLHFQNVPTGVGVLVPISVTASSGSTLTLTASEAGPFSAVPSLPNAATGLGQAVATGTSAVAIYELTTSSTNVDSFSIPVYLNDSNGVGTASAPITATVSFGPLNAPSNIPDFILPAGDTPLTGSAFTTTLSSGIVGVSYGPVTISVSGGVAPYTFSAASLPAGLTMSSAGVVTGTPVVSTSGLFTGSVVVTDSTGSAFTDYLGIRILPVLSITTSSLPAAPLNTAYSQTVAVQGGTPGYAFSVPANALPPGLSLNASTGVITGTATQTGTYSFMITVTDSGTVASTGLPAQVAARTFQLVVGLAISSTGPLYPAFVNAPYSTTLVSSNGNGALTWTVSAGTLPAGITLAPATGVLSGTPTVPGIYPFTIQVADSTTPTPQTQAHQYSLTVAQQYVISTIAGGVPPVTPQPALNASIGTPGPPAVDSAGNVYFASFNSIMKVDTSGNMTRIAGNGRPGYSGDGGPAINAQLFAPTQIAVDGAGNLYIADSDNLRVRKVSAATGIITTIAGGNTVSTQLVGLQGVAVDSAGNVYFTDTIHLNKLTPAGVFTNYFNANFIQFPGGPGAISVDSTGNIYFTDSAAVYKISPAGVQTTVAGTPGTTGYSGDGGPATAAVLWYPQTPMIDGAGNLFIYDSGNGRIREVSTGGTITTVMMDSNVGAVAMDSSGNFYGRNLVSGNQVMKLSPGGVVSAFAGNGTYEYSGNSGPASAAQISAARVALDSTGNIYFSDAKDSFIGWISSAGSFAQAFVTGTSANSSPQGLAIKEGGNPALDYVYYADSKKNQVMLCLPAGLGCGPFAGTGSAGSSGDGLSAINAQLSGPTDVALDSAGNVYIADTGNNRIRVVNTSGVISTYAGNGTPGFSGDGNQATTAQLNGPSGLAVFGGNVYVSDTNNNRVRLINSGGVITTVAGNDVIGSFVGGGPAVDTFLDEPEAISVDSQGNLYIVDADGHFLRLTTDGIINSFTGTTIRSFSGDGGPVQSATMTPMGVAVDSAGHVYEADGGYYFSTDSIRVLTPSTASPLNILTTTLPLTSSGEANYSAALTATGGTGSYTWSVLPQALPPGLSLNSTTGVITGTPGTAGFYDFTVTVADSGTVALTGTPAQTVSQNYRITVNSALALSAAVLPVATTNVAYSTSSISATGGTPSYTYSIVSGSLPNGLSLASLNGSISGAASVAGSYSFTVKVTDSGTTPQSATRTYQLTVQAPPIISTTSLPAGAVGSPYSATINVTPGTPPYTFSLTPNFGTLPAGLTLNSSTGTISGTPTTTGNNSGIPTAAGGSTFRISVTDSGTPPFTTGQSLSINVYSTITVTPAQLPAATAAAPYSFPLEAGGGASSSYVWSATGLPSWLSLTSSGVLSGTPPSVGSVPINLSVSDGVQTVQATVTLTVHASTGQTWTQLTPVGNLPPARYGHVALFDAAAGQMIIFGGTAGSGYLNDVWSYSLAGNSWSQLSPANNAPTPRMVSTGIYNAANSRMVIFGGSNFEDPVGYYNDVWALANANGVNGTPTWIELQPTGTLPSARSNATGVYDAGSNRMVMFSGADYIALFNDVWVLTNADGTGGTPAWVQLSPTGNPPSAREGASATYDPVANRMIVFGGYDANGLESDVWVLSNANGLGGTPVWTMQSPTGGPITPRSGHSAILDTASNQMTVFGGGAIESFIGTFSYPSSIATFDTWTLANANGVGATPSWTQLAPLGPLPSPRGSHSAVYGSSNNSMLIFGGFELTPDGNGSGIPLNDLWSLSDANGITSITSLSPTSIVAGNGAFTLTVNGEGFAPGSVVQWNGAALVTTFVSSTQLTAAVPAADVTAQASVNVTVQNPALAASAASTFTITAPVSTGGGGGGGGGGAPPPGNPLSVSPASLTFNVPAGTVASSQTIALSFPTFTQGAPGFTASFNTNQGSGWLSVAPSSGTMTQQSLNGLQYTYGATIMVSVNPANVPAGSSFTGTVNLSASGGIVSVPITMNVSSQPAKFTAAPTALTFSSQAGSATLPATQNLAVFSSPTGAGFTASASTTSGGSWLAISPSSGGVAPASFTVSANTAGLAAGSYLGQIAITGGTGTPLDVPVSLTVAPAQPPKISLSPSNPTFTLTQGAGSTAGQIAVSNAGGGTLQFSATASSTPSGWLQLGGSGGGSATSSSPTSQGFTVNPAGLSPGAYSGQITFTDAASNTDQATVAITLAVSQSSQSLSLSQSGLTFSGVQNGPAPPTQSFTVTIAGQGSLPWNATANMLSGSGWLSVTPSSGTATGGQTGSPVTVTVNQAGLTPGQYYGSVGVSAQNAANSPQTVSVLLSVGASGTVNTGPAVSTGALVFTGPAGGTAPPSQQVNIFNPASSPDSYTASAVTSDGAAWLSISPTGGPLNSGSNSLSVSTTLAGIAAGVHTGTIALSFGSGGTATIQVVLIATASSGSAVSGLRPRATFTSACAGGKPGYLVPVFAAPASQQSIQAGQANLLRVYLFDDCGDPVTASNGGVVQVDFGDGDGPVNLHDTGNGIWDGTWIPINVAAQVTLTAVASEGSLPSIGATVSVTLLAASVNSAGVPGGIVNAASQAVAIPGVVTPGSYITIYGSNLAGSGQGSASTIPLPFSLNGTQATIGNQPMPLLYAGPTQINALVPQSLNPNASYPLVIQNGLTQSVAVPLTLVSPQPAVYTANLSGSGQGVVEIAGTTLLAAPLSATSRPAVRGTDYLVIYCTGLGPVQGASGGAPPADGAAAPSTEVFQTADNVTVTIGGVSVSAAFAGLTPTLVGLYQINVQVPASAVSGGAVPLSVTVTNPLTGVAITSNTVTIALQ